MISSIVLFSKGNALQDGTADRLVDALLLPPPRDLTARLGGWVTSTKKERGKEIEIAGTKWVPVQTEEERDLKNFSGRTALKMPYDLRREI